MQATIPAESEGGATTIAQIHEALGQIYDVIDRVGQQLEKTFQDQEDKFLEEYRKQMYSAQKNLREYTKTHSQAELTKKIEEKERALRARREKALTSTTEKSNDLKTLKVNAGKLKQTLHELEDETNFIDEQLILSQEKNRRLGDEAKYLKLEIMKYQPDFEFWEEDFDMRNYEEPKKDNSTRMVKNVNFQENVFNSVETNRLPKMPSSSYRKKGSVKEGTFKVMRGDNVSEREMERLAKQYEKEVRNNQILNRVSEDPAFQKGKFEEIFEGSIRKTLDRNSEKSLEFNSTASTRLPYLSRSVDSMPAQEGDQIAMESNTSLEALNLTELKLTATDKKIMIEEFLSNKDIKDYLYSKFVEEGNKKTGPCLF